jgi:D-beta-D-heptose 7-phosphate kinase / D-beta-D-heptose 1-phosphate adenosyltransferase
MKPLVVVGDAFLDRDLDGRTDRLCPDAPVPVVTDPCGVSRPGGAGLAAALAAAADDRPVVLVTAIADDDIGRELCSLLDLHGVTVENLGSAAPTASKVRIRGMGHPLLRVDSGGDRTIDVGALGGAAAQMIDDADAVLVSDYGRGITGAPDLRAALARAGARRPLVWDPHPLGTTPIAGARVVTPNQVEARAATPEITGHDLRAWTRRADVLVRRWSAAAVAITLSERGALLSHGGGPPLMVPAIASTGDPCGAGDRFAAEVALGLARGALPSEAVTDAVTAASRFVASGGAGALRGEGPSAGPAERGVSRAPVDELVSHVRVSGGTVVATGGCFDVLHTGHVSLLESARRLGDCLVVLLNSDDSVRALKGPGRPLVTAAQRARVLSALACVDGVVEFGETTPAAALDRLRPDVWVKGADYSDAVLPEEEVVARWGGHCVVVPYVEGQSTTGLFQEVIRRGVP